MKRRWKSAGVNSWPSVSINGFVHAHQPISELAGMPDEFMMVGNSVRSDVLPVVEIGGRAVHVPYAITWEHEHVQGDLPERAVSVTRLLDILGD